MKLTMNTRIKFLKAQIVVFFTKRRYLGNSPRLKKFVTVMFLLGVNSFVVFNLFLQAPEFEIHMKGGFTVENPALAQNIAPSEVVEVKELTIEEKIAKTFPENPEVMIAVAKAESGLKPMAVNKNTNGSRDIGLFQINSVHGEDDLEMFDVDKNLEIARKVYDKQGITAWVAFTNGSYTKYLK